MGTITLPSWLRGIIIPDPRFTLANFDTTNSVYTEGDPQPGDVPMGVASDLVLEGVGSIASTTDLQGMTIHGGLPGVDGARFLWRQVGDPLWKSWARPVNLTGFRFIDRSNVADKWHPRHLCKLSDGTVLTVSMKDSRRIVAHIIDATTGAPTEVEIYDPGSAGTYDTHPCLLPLPSGRVLCYAWVEPSAFSQIRMWWSDDSGATWTEGSHSCLPAAVVTSGGGYTPGRVRVAQRSGQYLMTVQVQDPAGPEDQIWQYASVDGGCNFALVEKLTGTNRVYPDIVATESAFHVFYVGASPGGYAASYIGFVRTIGNAYELLSDADNIPISSSTDPMEWGTVGGGVFTAGEMAAWRDDDGIIYAAGVDHDTAGGAFYELMTRYSDDDAATWNVHAASASALAFVAHGYGSYGANDTSTYLKDVSIISHRGRGVVLSRHVANPSGYDDSISLAYLGGFTSVDPAQQASYTILPAWSTGYAHTWLPLDLPDNTGGIWTLTTAGAPTAVLTALGLHITTGGGESNVYSTGTLSGTLAEGIETVFEVRVESGTARLNLRISDATPLEYEVVAQVSTTAITLYDNKTPGTVASVATSAASGSHVQIKIAISTASAKMWYRTVGTHCPQAYQDWILVGSTAALGSAAANTGSKVIFGQDANSETYWRLVAYSHDQFTGVTIVDQTNPDDLVGRSYSPRPVYVTDGLSVQAIDGPTLRNETWTAAPRFTYPVSNVLTPSPREPWRSEDDDTQVDLEWDFGGDTWPMGSLLSVYLGGCNFGRAELWGKDGGGTWRDLGDLDLRVQTGLKFTLAHRLLQPDTSGGNSCAMYFPADILAGSHVSLPWQGEGAVVRTIEHNTGGSWVSGSTTQDVRILLESVDGTESSAGTTAEIWLKDGAFFRPITAVYSAFRIRIPVQPTAEGYFQIGALSIGHFHAFASEYGWGRGVETSPIYEMTTNRAGIRRTRKLAPARRAVDLPWMDGVNTGNGTSANPNPDIVIGWTGGNKAASVGVSAMTLHDLAGQLERCGGATTPVTYVGAMAPPGSSTTIARVVNRALTLHGRIATETHRMDNVLGDEWTSTGELLRGSTLRIEEEP